MQYNKGAGALADAVSSLGVSPGKPLVIVGRSWMPFAEDVQLVASEGSLYAAGGHSD